jgi:fatty-acid desaturase
MFYLSLLPLWCSIAFIDVKSITCGAANIWTEIISLSIMLICLIISVIVLSISFSKRKTVNSKTYTITAVKEEKLITVEYLLSYILPLFAFDFTVWYSVVLFLLFFVVLSFLCIRHSSFSANITLEFIGYRFYKCTLKNENGIKISKIVVSKDNLLNRKNEEISTRALNNEYHIDITKKAKVHPIS